MREVSEVLSTTYRVQKNVYASDFSLMVSGSDEKSVEILSKIIKEETLNLIKTEEKTYLELKINMVKDKSLVYPVKILGAIKSAQGHIIYGK